MFVSPNRSSSLPRKKGGMLSKKVIKTTSISDLQKPALSQEEKKTPTRRVSDMIHIPQTAPSKLENRSDKNSIEFTVWEDPLLAENKSTDSIVIEEGNCFVDSAEDISSEKENHSQPPSNPSTTDLSPVLPISDSPRQTLSDLKVSGMQEYQDLLGKAFKVACSPKAMFYHGLSVNSARPTNTGSSPFFKLPFAGVPYSKELPPPSKLTRTHGSDFFRVTSVNLFKKSASEKNSLSMQKESQYMDSLSPSTPHKLPEHIHNSRLSKRVFRATKLYLTSDPIYFVKKDDGLLQEPSTLVKESVDKTLSTSLHPSYNLRPRTKQQSSLGLNQNYISMNKTDSLPPLSTYAKKKAQRKS
jgi:hypothetical protein